MSENHEFVSIYVMVESEDVAVHISTALVKEKLIACANVNAGTRSIYEWDGMIQLDNEITVFMKTHASKLQDAIKRIKEMHSYEVPSITATPIVGANADYLDWVRKQVGL